MAGAPGEQSGPIAVYGASGYTGRLVAAELARTGAEFVLAGRNRAKLEIVAEDVGGAEVRPASLDDPRALRDLLEPCAAVIACAGPFRLHGEPVVRAAVDSRTHYVDTTGEQPFIRLVFDEYGTRAASQAVCLVPAMGFDYAPGDMISALTAEGSGDVDEVVLAYATSGLGVSRGTARTALGMIAADSLEWRDGELVPDRGGVGRGTFTFPSPFGRQRMVRYPSGEHLTVPRHVRTRRVRTMLTAATAMPHASLAIAAPVLMPLTATALRTPARRVIEAAVGRLPEGPDPEGRRRARFAIVCEVSQGSRKRRGIVTGHDIYGLTARTTVEAARQLAAPGFDRRGALAPSEAFEPREFMRSLGGFGVQYEVAPA
jgi:short subunit dehydrogenase-like uncharacterized protein